MPYSQILKGIGTWVEIGTLSLFSYNESKSMPNRVYLCPVCNVP
ncbi:hypothetical protein Hamer_G007449 [Homarus americanus]|uniref:Uncharacterized protein n=1 Tax=Homarus americanus TaxID=6706 RepID=A0A8J5JU18_HOMAM|nr:hypothetical protein Hamer_G007449 [Homarus americanus]